MKRGLSKAIILLLVSLLVVLIWRVSVSKLLILKAQKRASLAAPAKFSLNKLTNGNDNKQSLLSKDPALSEGLAYTTILLNDSEINLTKLESLIESIQAHIIKHQERAIIYLFHSIKKEEFRVLNSLKFVKSVSLEILNKELFKSESSVTTMAKIIPHVLEYLLLEYPKVIYIDFNYGIEEKTIPEVLRIAGKFGQVIVPSSDYQGRMAKVNPAITDVVFPLLAFTRSAFVEIIKPVLDHQRGLQGIKNKKDTTLAKSPSSGSIVRRSAISLFKASARVADSNNNEHMLTKNIFDFVEANDENRLEKSGKLKIGLWLDLQSEKDLGLQLGNLIKLILRQDGYDNFAYIIYLINSSGTLPTKFKELVKSSMASDKVSEMYLKASTITTTVPSELCLKIAMEDGCEYFYHFGTPPVIPSGRSGNLIRMLTRSAHKHDERLNLITIVNGDAELWLLKELIGSIHGCLQDQSMSLAPFISVIGVGLCKTNQAMIKLWEWVEFYDFHELLLGFHPHREQAAETVIDIDSASIRILVLEIFTKKLKSAIFVDRRLMFTKDTAELLRQQLLTDESVSASMEIEGQTHLVIDGYLQGRFEQVHAPFLDCLRRNLVDCPKLDGPFGNEVRDARSFYKLASPLPKPTDASQRSQQYCHLSLRQEIMYNPMLFGFKKSVAEWIHPKIDEKIIKETKKTKVAFLIPSKNSADEIPENVHLVTTFLKSMLSSIKTEELNLFLYTVYVGYDQDDPILDKRRDELDGVIEKLLGPKYKECVLIKYHLLPTVKCVTLLWNVLFVDAVNDGNDYFYQVNDDVSIQSSGWTSQFVSKLRASDDFGVVAPNDQMWQCRLFTQSFVSRKHYEIFRWYFPTIIKDWYSDNWITQVYGENSFCIKEMMIRNGAAKTRYNVCDKPKWGQALKDGIEQIAEWKRQNIKALAKQLPDAP